MQQQHPSQKKSTFYNPWLSTSWAEGGDPIPLLPTQFSNYAGDHTPEKNLFSALLEDLVVSLLREARLAKHSTRNARLLEEDLCYLRVHEPTRVGSFDFCCHALGFDDEYVREGILKKLAEADQHPPPIGQLRRHKEPMGRPRRVA